MVSNSHQSVESRLNTNCIIQTPSIDRELKPHGDIHGETPIRSTDRHSCRQNETTRRRQSRIWNLWESGQGFGTVTRNRMGCQWMERLLRYRIWWCLISLVCSIQSLFENWKKKSVSNGNELKNFSYRWKRMAIPALTDWSRLRTQTNYRAPFLIHLKGRRSVSYNSSHSDLFKTVLISFCEVNTISKKLS